KLVKTEAELSEPSVNRPSLNIISFKWHLWNCHEEPQDSGMETETPHSLHVSTGIFTNFKCLDISHDH
ncbi:unnamed protein product, partial [Gulo gulo]